MKATPKSVILVSLAVLDILVGILVIATTFEGNSIVEKSTVKTSSNAVVVNDVFDLKMVAKKQEEEKKKNEVKEEIVYDGLTMEQLGAKLNRSLKGKMKGKGPLIAQYSLSKGVDPYVATAIILLETGCEWNCSTLVTSCNNVGGQKGSGCGSYAKFSSLDDGIKKFINNLSKNYYAKGLNTPEKMGPKYAESKTWAKKVNNYVKKIKSK